MIFYYSARQKEKWQTEQICCHSSSMSQTNSLKQDIVQWDAPHMVGVFVMKTEDTRLRLSQLVMFINGWVQKRCKYSVSSTPIPWYICICEVTCLCDAMPSTFTHWGRVTLICVIKIIIIIPHTQQSCWGVYWFHFVCPSVRLSVPLSVSAL